MADPADKYIPANTVLTQRQKGVVDDVIKRKEGELSKLRGCTDKSLYLMMELEHLRNLRDFNKKEVDAKAE